MLLFGLFTQEVKTARNHYLCQSFYSRTLKIFTTKTAKHSQQKWQIIHNED